MGAQRMKSSQKISILRVLQAMCAALVLLTQSALAQTATHTEPSDLAVVPAQQGYVVDTTGRLSAAERDSLISELKQLNASSGAQVFVLVVDHTDPEPIESYAQRVFTTWKPGRKGVDDGALLLIALNNKTKRLRLHTGYGLEGSVPDVSAKRLLANEVRPALESRGAYAAAMAGVVGVRDLLAKDATRQNSGTAVDAQPDKNAEIKLVGVVFAQLAPLILVIIGLGRPRTRPLAAFVSALACVMVAAIYWLLRGDDGLSSLAAFFWLAIPVWLLLAFAGRTPKVSQSRTGMLPPIKQKDRASMPARQRRQRALAEKASRPVARVKARVPPGFTYWLALAALALSIVGRIGVHLFLVQ